MFKTTTYQQAKECGEISQEILVYPAQKVFIDKSGITLLESSGGGIYQMILALYNAPLNPPLFNLI